MRVRELFRGFFQGGRRRDPFEAWFRERVTLDVGQTAATARNVFYWDYEAWVAERGAAPLALVDFSRAMLVRGVQIAAIDYQGLRHYRAALKTSVLRDGRIIDLLPRGARPRREAPPSRPAPASRPIVVWPRAEAWRR